MRYSRLLIFTFLRCESSDSIFPQATVDQTHEAQRVESLVMQTFKFAQDRLLSVRERMKSEEAARVAVGAASGGSNSAMLGFQGPAVENNLPGEEQPCDTTIPLREVEALVHGGETVAVDESGLWLEKVGDWKVEEKEEEDCASPGASGMHATNEPCCPDACTEPPVALRPAAAPPPAGRRKRAVGAAGGRDGSGKLARREDRFGHG